MPSVSESQKKPQSVDDETSPAAKRQKAGPSSSSSGKAAADPSEKVQKQTAAAMKKAQKVAEKAQKAAAKEAAKMKKEHVQKLRKEMVAKLKDDMDGEDGSVTWQPFQPDDFKVMFCDPVGVPYYSGNMSFPETDDDEIKHIFGCVITKKGYKLMDMDIEYVADSRTLTIHYSGEYNRRRDSLF
ncbi:unnamed protein product [Amoebophrya sp. A25]|nr:unnamed protein product [Amoebophrya sp. A25]|eukprot:GSA25T00011920001.1